MKSLVSDLKDLGCKNVKTYIQSGNIVFSKSGVSASKLASLIGERVHDRHGFLPKVHILEAKDIEKAVRQNPFPDASADPKSLHLMFLSKIPGAANLQALEGIKASSEEFRLVGSILYLNAPDGIARSRLAARAEKLLGVSATSRNWRTVGKLIALAGQLN